jgi:hypothetical protein
MLQQMILIIKITFFKCCIIERWFDMFPFSMFYGWFCDVVVLPFEMLQYIYFGMLQFIIFDVTVHIFMLHYIVLRCCSILYFNVALYSLHNLRYCI